MKTALRLIGLLRAYRSLVALSVLLGAATVAAAIGLLGTSAYLIARAALHPSIAVLQVAVVGVRFFGIARAVLRYLERLVSHSVNFALLARLRVWFYAALEPLAPARLQDLHSGDLLARSIADIDTLENFYVRAVAPPLSAVVVVAGVAAYVGSFDLRMAAVLLGALAAAGVGLPLLAHAMSREPGQALIAQRAELNTALVDTVQGLSELLAFQRAEAQVEKVLALGKGYAAARMRVGHAGALVNGLAALISGLALWGVLLVGLPLVGSRLDGVMLAVLALVTLAAFEAVAPLPGAAQHLSSSLAAAQRLFAVADAEPVVLPPVDPAPPPLKMDLRIRGLTFRYEPGLPASVADFDLDLPPGKRVALIGASGAGKTTVLNLLLRLWEGYQGDICLDGRDLRAYAPEDVRAGMAVITQSTYLFAATLRQNLLLAQPDASEEALWEALRLAGLADFVRGLGQGLDSWIGERGVQISGGERQRVALARAVLRLQAGCPLLLLDEPTAHLDAISERKFMTDLLKVSQGRSMLLITHRPVGLETMDEVVVMQAGRVIERGTRTGAVIRT